MATNNEKLLMEKIIRAKVRLESMVTGHSDNCMIELDQDYTGPCTCGAGVRDSQIKAAIKELTL